MNKKIFVILLLVIPILSSAQRWKRYRYEFQSGFGATNFLGEFGGANQDGTDFIKDLELSQTRPSAIFAARYRLHDYYAVKVNFAYGRVSGNDALTEWEIRQNRNLSFFSNIYEFSGQFEFSWRKERVGHIYKLRSRGVKGQNALSIWVYGFVGLGTFYYNPKAKLDGETYVLQPLGTEGQGIYKTRDKYSRINVAVPFGFGLKHNINKKFSVLMEFGVRKTFTDYIDDASKTYADGVALIQNGVVVPVLADRSGELTTDPLITGNYDNGNQRGDWTDNDAYMFLNFMVTYTMRNGRDNLPKF